MTWRLDGLSKSSAIALAAAAVTALSTACSSDSGVERDAETLMPGAAGAAGAMSPEGVMPGTGPNLLVSESWVDAATNGIGVQGAFFTYQDGSGRTVINADATRTQTGYCVAGTAAEVIDGDFGGTYGAVAALNLAQQVDSTTADAYDATAFGVVGFGFDIVGNTGGALRFVVKQYATHDGFCIETVPDCAAGCTMEYRIDALTQNCWTPGGPVPAAQSLQALEWQITTKEGAATDFDYCIENIHAVVDPAVAPARAPAGDEDVPGRYGGY
ncbi:MAG TPA: hypothetical protein VMG12_11395 [Polyangiaceae bacterium]|nr:hypothetical protein [Polyangiaceae bacterium]